MTPQQEVEYTIYHYRQLLKEMIELTEEDELERAVAFCQNESGEIYPTEVEVGSKEWVHPPVTECLDRGDKPSGDFHTHPHGDLELSTSDYYGLLEPLNLNFKCVGTLKHGKYYVKCALRPQTDEYRQDPAYERLKFCLEELQFTKDTEQSRILKYCISKSTQELVEKYGEIRTFKL